LSAMVVVVVVAVAVAVCAGLCASLLHGAQSTPIQLWLWAHNHLATSG
jgi:hypothetical protein